MAGAGVVCIITALLWFISAASLAILKPKKIPESSGFQGNTLEMAQVAPPNGVPVTVPEGGPTTGQAGNIPMTRIVTENRVQPDGSTIQVTLQIITHPDGSETTVMMNQVPVYETELGVPVVMATPIKEDIDDEKIAKS